MREKVKIKRLISFILVLIVVATTSFNVTFLSSASKTKHASDDLSTTSCFLILKNKQRENYKFRIKKSAKIKDAKYMWYVTKVLGNPDAITINKKTGIVTAKEAGIAYIRCKITFADGTTLRPKDRPQSRVVVRNNISEIKISNLPKDLTINAKEETKFNYDIVNTVAGKNLKTGGYIHWELKEDDAGVEEINHDGIVLPKNEGSFKIRLVTFQSKTKYNYWLQDKEKNAIYITAASDWHTINVIDTKDQNTDDNEDIEDIEDNKGNGNNNTQDIKVESISIDGGNIELTVDQTKNLQVSFNPYNVTNKKLNWQSSNENVALVDANGKVTALSAGNAIITVRSEDGNKSSSIEITVKNKVVLVNEISLEGLDGISQIDTDGGSLMMVATLEPDNASDKSLTWSVTNMDGTITDKAMISNIGLLTALKDGTVKVIAVANDGSNKTASTEITISNQRYAYLSDFEVKGGKNISLGDNNSFTIYLDNDTFNPLNKDDEVSSWISNLPSGLVAKISDNVDFASTHANIIISGTSSMAYTGEIEVKIPALALDSNKELKVDINSATIFDIKESFEVIVVDGTGSGYYIEGANVSISLVSNEPLAAGKGFDCWVSSNLDGFEDENSENMEFIMPAKDVTIWPTYKDLYSQEDIATMNKIIEDNIGIIVKWELGSMPPSSWDSIVKWDDSSLKRIIELNFQKNLLSGELDLSELSELEKLNCSSNNLTGLNVLGLNKLEEINCSSNKLTELNVSGLNKLKYLFCNYNKIESLDLSDMESLIIFQCYNNELVELNLSNMPNLTDLYISDNQLSKVQILACDNLEILLCDRNKLTNIDVSAFTMLEQLGCGDNQLREIDVSGLSRLRFLGLYRNEIESINLEGLISLTSLGTYENYIQELVGINGEKLIVENNGGGIGVVSASIRNGDLEISLISQRQDTYYFDEWELISGNLVIENQKRENIVFIMPNEDIVIKVNFIPKPRPIQGIGPISGVAKVGEELIAGAVTPEEATVSYQWYISDEEKGEYLPIIGATDKRYTITEADFGKYIKVLVEGTGIYVATQRSNVVGPILAN